MKRKCIDGLLHEITGIAPAVEYPPTFYTWCSPRQGMRLYEYVRWDAPLTCLQCVTLSSLLGAVSHGSSGGQM